METRPIPWPSFAIGVPSEVCRSSVAHWNFSVTTSVHDLHTWTFRAHPFQFAQVLDRGLTSSTLPMETCHVGDLVGNHHGHCIRVLPAELLCLWSLQQNSVSSCPIIPQFRSVKKHSAWNKAINFGFQLIQYELKPFWLQNFFSGDLKPPRESWRYLQIVQWNPCQSEQEWRLSISTELQGYDIPGADRKLQTNARPLFEFSQETTQLKPPWPSFSCNC